MGRRSKIEDHPQSEEIIRRLASGEEYSKIVEDYPNIRYQDLDYYARNKLPEILSKSNDLKALADEIERADIHRGDSYLQLIIGLQKKALDALELQDAAVDPKAWATISREARGYVELLGRALSRIESQPQITLQQVNIYSSPEWRAVGEVLARILAGHPELKAAVAAELKALAEGQQ